MILNLINNKYLMKVIENKKIKTFKVETSKTSFQKQNNLRRDEGFSNKKVEELKILYKKLTVKAISFNIERSNNEEVERDLKRLATASYSNASLTELILLDQYFSILEYKKGMMKNFLTYINKCLKRMETIDIHTEISMDEDDKFLFEKCVFNTCKAIINDIFSSEKTFRSILPQVFECYDDFIASLMTKEHINTFTYFLAILCFTKKNNVKNKDHFIKLFKEKTSIIEQSKNDDKVTTMTITSDKDVICIAMRDIVNRIENYITMETDSGKKSRKAQFKSIDHFSNPNSITSSPSCKQSKKLLKVTKISNYQKYIKNIKNKRERDTLTPNPIPSNNIHIASKENKFSKKSSKSTLRFERDESSSANNLKFNGSTNDLTSNQNDANNMKNKIPIDLTLLKNISNKEENIYENDHFDNIVVIIDKIDSKLNDMNGQLSCFGNHLEDLRNLLGKKL